MEPVHVVIRVAPYAQPALRDYQFANYVKMAIIE
jgi:hypothetical protein